MYQTTHNNRNHKRRRGQTLAEFSLTLPILLLLTFGIIEFGRIFQAWITIQNSARETARYLTTGQADLDRYTLDEVVPCLVDDGVTVDPFAPYTPKTIREDAGPGVNAFFRAKDPITGQYILQGEDLYRTWFDGQDCVPGPDSDERRKDIIRVISAMEVARRSASGLSLEDSILDGTAQGFVDVLINNWTLINEDGDGELTRPREKDPGYFEVQICSTRPVLDNGNGQIVTFAPGNTNPDTRFWTISETSDLPINSPEINDIYDFGFGDPYCMMNELQNLQDAEGAAIPGAIQNGGIPWYDPGGPGDRVSVFVKFNHPLITPLGLAEYIQMTARRSAVVEAFRSSRAVNAIQQAPPGTGSDDDTDPLPPPEVTAEPTPSYTPTLTATPTATPTDTPPPFVCDELIVSNLQIFGQRVFIDIDNRNYQTTELVSTYLSWRTPEAFPGMFMAAQSVNDEVLWSGEQNVAPFAVPDDLDGAETSNFLAANRSIPGQLTISQWEGLYLGAGFNLVTDAGLQPWDWAGSYFDFAIPGVNYSNTDPATFCRVQVDVPPAPEPDDDDDDLGTSTPTYTPDCASSTLSIQFIEYQNGGVILLQVTNDRYQPAPFNGFEVNWIDPASVDPDATGVLTFRRMVAGGRSADDFGQPSSEGILVWNGPEDWGDGGRNGDRQPTSLHTEGDPARGGFWRDDYVFAPRSQTLLYLDFEGTSSTLANAFNVGPDMLNGSYFNIGCGGGGSGGSGGSGGGGNGGDGDIFISEIPTRAPTRTPRPTNTPGPTPTPSPTRPSPTPSATNTPGPTPTDRPEPTPTNTEQAGRPTAVPTRSGSGGEV